MFNGICIPGNYGGGTGIIYTKNYILYVELKWTVQNKHWLNLLKKNEKDVNNVVGNNDWELVILSQSSGNVLLISL